MKLLTFALMITVISTSALARPAKCRLVTSISYSAAIEKGYTRIDSLSAEEGDYIESVRILETERYRFLDSGREKVTFEQVIERKLSSGSEVVYAEQHTKKVKGGYLTYVSDYQIEEAIDAVRVKNLPSCKKISKR